MDERAAEQRQADARLAQAVQAVSEAYGYLPPGAVLADFVVVAEAVSYDDDGATREHHSLAMRDGSGRTSVTLGLLNYGIHLLLHGQRVDGVDG